MQSRADGGRGTAAQSRSTGRRVASKSGAAAELKQIGRRRPGPSWQRRRPMEELVGRCRSEECGAPESAQQMARVAARSAASE